MKKKLDLERFALTFEIPTGGIGAIVNGWNMSFAPGRHTITDPAVAKFLYFYPGVELVAVRPKPPEGPIRDDDPRVFDPCPEQPRVFNGGFSGGGVGEYKTKSITGK